MARRRKTDLNVELARPARRQGLWEGIASAVREAIVDGRIGPGIDLGEAILAEKFSVSRGPVREALRELAREGLVVDSLHRGSVVATLTVEDLREVYEVREGLEYSAARRIVERASDAEIRALYQHIHQMEAWNRGLDYEESLVVDLNFHRDLVALSGNRRMGLAYEQMLSQTRLLVRAGTKSNPRLDSSRRRDAHRDILEAMLRRDVQQAQVAILHHYRLGEDQILGASRGAEAETSSVRDPR